jgi:hypothetical protein
MAVATPTSVHRTYSSRGLDRLQGFATGGLPRHKSTASVMEGLRISEETLPLEGTIPRKMVSETLRL